MIDLGSGAGFDVFLAARKVGESGRVIGVDMNEVSSRSHDYPMSCLSNTWFLLYIGYA